MGREIRIGLLLAAAACLVAALVDWVVEELGCEPAQASAAASPVSEAEPASAGASPVSEAEPASVDAPQEGAVGAQDATDGGPGQG